MRLGSGAFRLQNLIFGQAARAAWPGAARLAQSMRPRAAADVVSAQEVSGQRLGTKFAD